MGPCSSTSTPASTTPRLLYACASPEAELSGDLLSGNVEARQVARTRAPCWSWPAAPTSRWRWGARCRCAPPARRRPRRTGRGARLRGAAAATAPGLGAATPPTSSSRPLAPGRARSRSSRSARSPTSPWRSCASRSCRGCCGLVMMVGSYRSRQHGADHRVERPSIRRPRALRAWSAAGDGVPRPLALGLDVTERAKLTPDHLTARPACRQQPDDRPTSATIRVAGNPSCASSTTRSASTWSSTAATTASMAPSSTTRWRWRRRSTRPVRTEALTVEVELGGTLTTGETVTDWRRVWGRPPNLDVAVEADAARSSSGSSSASGGSRRAGRTWHATREGSGPAFGMPEQPMPQEGIDGQLELAADLWRGADRGLRRTSRSSTWSRSSSAWS